MRKCVFAASGLLAAILGIVSGATASAKPGHPPVDNQVHGTKNGEDAPHGSIVIGFDLLTKRFIVKVEINKSETPMTLDAVTPSIVPAIVEELLQQACRTGETAKAIAAQREKQAMQLFKIAESCRDKGDYEKARTCYQQVHILTPASRFGQLAMDRLTEVEERLRESAEEQDAPPHNDNQEQAYRNIRRNSIPLGLVEVSY